MKLVSYELATPVTGPLQRVGVLLDGPESAYVVDARNAVAEVFRLQRGGRNRPEAHVASDDMLDLIQAGPSVLEVLREAAAVAAERLQGRSPDAVLGERGKQLAFDLRDVRLLPPLRPVEILDPGNYEGHIARSFAKMGLEVPKVWYERPAFYRSGVANLAGPTDPIIWPRMSKQLDYELEVAAVIGRAGKDIEPDEALDYIFGYTIFNDVTARDIQASEMPLGSGPFKSKNFENSNVIGPCILTADEVADPQGLGMWARCNGKLWTEANTSGMHKSFAQLVSYVSTDEYLRPGQLIASGTPDGGCGLENGNWLSVGDTIELEVAGIGLLANKVVAAASMPGRRFVDQAAVQHR